MSFWGKPVRFAALPATVIALAVAGGALAPAARAAGITGGAWTTPTANATVSGATVSLQFSTNDTSVSFVLPYGNETATVSGGVASGTFDSTKVANGQAKLGAMECNVLGQCDEVDETVTVSNPVVSPTPPSTAAPTFSPATGATVTAGSTILISGSGTASVTVSVNYQVQNTVSVTLPYTLTTAQPAGYAAGTYEYGVSVAPDAGAGANAMYSLVVPDTTPPVISNLNYPTTYFPVRDGFRDHFFAEFTTNEASTAILTMYKAGKVVSSGTVPITNTQLVDLRAGDRLKPGKYQWQLSVTDTAGNVAKTPMRTVTADGRHLINHKTSTTVTAASLKLDDLSESCSTARKSGTSVVLTSSSKCKGASGSVAEAVVFPLVKSAVDYGTLTLKLHSQGLGAVLVFNYGTQMFDIGKKLGNGTTTLTFNDLHVGYPKPAIALALLTGTGHTLTLSSVSVSYVYKTLSKK